MFETLTVTISPDVLCIEPIQAHPPQTPPCSLVIQRDTGAISIQQQQQQQQYQYQLSGHLEVLTVYGILGCIKLNAGDFLVLATDRQKLGSVWGGDTVYRLSSHKIIPIPKSRLLLQLSPQQIKDDDTYLAMLNQQLDSGHIYFSYSLDLTNCLQRTIMQQQQQQKHGSLCPLWEMADDRFFWNRHLQSRFIDLSTKENSQSYGNFILPVICGFVEITSAKINNKEFIFSLISRRSRYRAGTRYNMRGVDEEGNVANFVETEHVISYPDKRARVSYVQTRGSMPLFWRQIPNIKYVPILEITQHPAMADSFRRHFINQIHYYGNQIVVNLINKKGYEKRLGDEFLKQINLMNDVRVHYNHFDFHHHCRKMKYENINVLIGQIEKELSSQGYCQVDDFDKILRTQTSVVRTNCMDCLDRTNVVQSVLSRLLVNKQLRDLGILAQDDMRDCVEASGEFERVFKNIWADNADAISNQYSGTGALKTDYTRTGKRSTAGILNDGKNSLVRYFKNNFMDGWRQDSFDLLLGRFELDARGGGSSPLQHSDAKRTLALVPVFGLLLSLLAVAFIFATETNGFYPYGYLYILFFSLMAAGSLRIIVLFGQEYVDKPRLVPFKPVHVAAGVSSSDDAAAAPPYYSLDYETRKKKDDDLFLKTL